MVWPPDLFSPENRAFSHLAMIHLAIWSWRARRCHLRRHYWRPSVRPPSLAYFARFMASPLG